MVKKVNLILFLVLFFLAIMLSKASAANHKFLAVDNTTNFTITIDGTTNYTLNAKFNVTVSNATSPINATWFMPWGMIPANTAVCNATQGFRRINITTVACSLNVANRINTAPRFKNNTFTKLVIIENISAFPLGLTKAEKFWVEISSNDTGSVKNTTAAKRRFGVPYKINPRPYANLTSTSYNSTFRFISWNQTRPSYEVWVPIFSFNTTSGNPTVANKTYAEIIYADKSFLQNPTIFEMWSFRLNFTIYFNGAKNATYDVYINTINTTAQVFKPLTISSYSVPTLDKENVTRSYAFPSGSGGFSVWFNKTRYTNTTLSNNFKINVSFNNNFGTGLAPERYRLLRIAAPSRYGSNVNLSILFTLFKNNASTASPIYVENQNILGFNPAAGDAPPEAGKNKTMNFKIQIKNLMQNYTLRQLKIRFLIPINASIRNGSRPSSKLVYTYNVTWLDTAGVWNYTLKRSIMTRRVTCAGLLDHIDNSPSRGSNLTICFYNYDINLTHNKFNLWNPGNAAATNLTANMTAIFSFPVMNKSDTTPDSPGSRNHYNATISVSQSGKLNLTNEIPGLDGSDTNVVIKVDGIPLTGNYTIGSLVINNVNQGSHSISVSYSSPSSPAGASLGGGGGSSGIGGTALTDITTEMKRGSGVVFTVKGVKHVLKLHTIDVIPKLASFTLTSIPINFSLTEHQSRLFDADSNNINDLNITLQAIGTNRITIRIKEMVETQPITTTIPPAIEGITGQVISQPTTIISETQKLPSEEKNRNKLPIIIAVLFLITAVIVSLKLHNKPRKKH